MHSPQCWCNPYDKYVATGIRRENARARMVNGALAGGTQGTAAPGGGLGGGGAPGARAHRGASASSALRTRQGVCCWQQLSGKRRGARKRGRWAAGRRRGGQARRRLKGRAEELSRGKKKRGRVVGVLGGGIYFETRAVALCSWGVSALGGTSDASAKNRQKRKRHASATRTGQKGN